MTPSGDTHGVDTMQKTVDSETMKANGAGFWDENPCGGDRTTYREFLQWYQRTEPYISNCTAFLS